MTALSGARSGRRAAPRRVRRARRGPRTRERLAVFALVAAFLLAAIPAVPAPPPPTASELLTAFAAEHAQSITVPDAVAGTDVTRDKYSATAGIETLAASGTNYDWAKLVLLSGGWPVSDANVTVLTRWMRQENGADNWWNRNNPLNNGYGSGGGGGLGSYPDLVVAAQKAAENLHRGKSYAAIVAALATSAPTEVTEQAIWASPWSSSHYANGSHWHYTPVAVVKSPSGTW